MSDKENTLMNVLIEVVLRHFETTCDNFDISGVSTYDDTDENYLELFMEKLCIHLGDREYNSTFKYDSSRMEIISSLVWIVFF